MICQKCNCLLASNEGYEIFKNIFVCDQCYNDVSYLKIYGYSDDLVEIEGKLNGKKMEEEFDCYDCYDSCVFKVLEIKNNNNEKCYIYGYYSNDGIWSFFPSKKDEYINFPDNIKFFINTRDDVRYSMELGILFLDDNFEIMYLID